MWSLRDGRPQKSIAKPTEKKSEDDVDESLRELVGRPFFLRAKSRADASPVDAKKKEAQRSTEARLTKEQVADLADAEARKRGYNPAEYGRTEPKYHLDDRVWSINYERPAPDEMESGKRFSVMIDDKTKGIVFVPGKN